MESKLLIKCSVGLLELGNTAQRILLGVWLCLELQENDDKNKSGLPSSGFSAKISAWREVGDLRVLFKKSEMHPKKV